MIKWIAAFLMISFIFIQGVTAEESYNVSTSSFTMKGSANTGSWDCVSSTVRGNITTRIENGEVIITELELIIPVGGFDCDQSRLTNSMYKYIKKDEHPEIRYHLRRTHPRAMAFNSGEGLFYGTVNVAGVDKMIRSPIHIEKTANGWRISGIQNLKMTYFEIDPPTAMFGTVRARDEVDIEYTIEFR